MRRERQIEAIFFDLGRVIIDFNHMPIARKLLKKAVHKTAVPPDEVFDWLFAPVQGICSAFDRGEISPEDFFSRICSRYGLELTFKEFGSIWNENFKEILEVSRIIEELSSHYPLYLISNTNSLHFDYIVERFHILEHFQAYILSYREGLCKPDPEIYHAAVTRARTQADRSVYIDDIAEYVDAARQLGFHGIHFTSAPDLKSRLTALLPFQFSD